MTPEATAAIDTMSLLMEIFLDISSNENAIPDSGALKATDNPAPATAVYKSDCSTTLWRNNFPHSEPIMAAI